MADGFQTAEAALGCAQAAYKICRFLNRVRKADETAEEAARKVSQAGQTLDNVAIALRWREQNALAHDGTDSNQVGSQIDDSVKACEKIFHQISTRLGGLNDTEDRALMATLMDRFRVAFRHGSLGKLQADLDVHITILQTSLVILQLYDGPSTKNAIVSSHDVIVGLLRQLEEKIDRGNDLKKALAKNGPSDHATQQMDEDQNDHDPLDDCDDDAISSLEKWLETAADLHEHFSSEYKPDVRSEYRRQSVTVSTPDMMSPRSGSPAPQLKLTEEALSKIPDTSSTIEVPDSPGEVPEDDDDELPEALLTRHINSCRKEARQHLEDDRLNQAEAHLNRAIEYSERRSRHYNVHFDDKSELSEELATVYQKTEKWQEAISMLSRLIRERKITKDMPRDIQIQKKCRHARQSQLLASIYLDKYSKDQGGAEEIESAETYGIKAYTIRENLIKDGVLIPDENDRQNECIRLLIRILDARDKTPEANDFRDILAVASGQVDSLPLRQRASTLTTWGPETKDEFAQVEGRQQDLLRTITTGTSEELHDLLTVHEDIDLEHMDSEGKTPLMHAVTRNDPSIAISVVNSLISAGASPDTRNRDYFTALHFAARAGNRDSIICLLEKDADKEARDTNGETPLTLAVRKNKLKAARELIERGADTGTKNNHGWNLLHYAIHYSNVEMINYLLSEAPELRSAVDIKGQTALHHCATEVRVGQMKALLEHKNKLDVQALDHASRTALFLVASKAYSTTTAELVGLLLEHGSKLSPLHLPSRAGDYPALKRFMKVEATSSNDTTSSSDASSGSSYVATEKKPRAHTFVKRIFSPKAAR